MKTFEVKINTSDLALISSILRSLADRIDEGGDIDFYRAIGSPNGPIGYFGFNPQKPTERKS